MFLAALKVFLIFVLLLTDAHGQYQDGDVRLVGGSYQWEGRVEVYMSGVWGTITDSDWTNDDATVVCRKLGHYRPGAMAHSNAYFGEGKGPVNLDSVICSGSEYILTDCELQNSGLTTSHSLDVGVKCQPAYGSYREGDIRLVGGPHNWEGRVEIFWKGQWGAISGKDWDDAQARVACRQLQHVDGSGVAVRCCREYGSGSGMINIRNVYCYSTENKIIKCQYTNVTTSLAHDQDVGAKCQQGNEAREGEIRFNRTGGMANSRMSRVEIFFSGKWGNVCPNQPGTKEARVVCRQLGYNPYDATFGQLGNSPGPIHIAPVCAGSEYRLAECINQTTTCITSTKWGVECKTDGPEPLDVRLSSGTYASGFVQVFTSGAWTPIANTLDKWNLNSSRVVCKQLGYDPTGTVMNGRFNPYTKNYTTMDNVECKGTESNLTECHHDLHFVDHISRVYQVGCQHYNCLDGTIRLAGGDSEREGRVEVCSNKRWGTVCDKDWSNRHTSVVCRFLGFSDLLVDIKAFSSEEYGKGVGPVLVDYINCTGLEGNLWNKCIHRTHYFGCTHDADVGVKCQPARCAEGQLRLTDGTSQSNGRLEICSNRQWQGLLLVNWITANSMVACKELGFQNQYGNHYYGNGGGQRYSMYYFCNGRERRLIECHGFNDSYTRHQTEDVGLQCGTVDCVNGEMRLVDGLKEWEGRLEVCYNRRWGTVGGDGWTEANTLVVCNALGYDTSNVSTFARPIPNAPSKPLYYHSIRCSRRDLSLLECGFTRYTNFIKTYTQAVVKCNESGCSDGQLRLVGGLSETEGRLEVCFNKRWGTIDGTKWTHSDTQVACRQLKYSTHDVSYSTIERKRYQGSKNLPTFLTLVGCHGTENNITNCSCHNFTTNSHMVVTMDVSISCGGGTEQSGGFGSIGYNGVAAVALIISLMLLFAVAGYFTMVAIKKIKRKRKVTMATAIKGDSAKMEENPHYMESSVVDNVAYSGAGKKPTKFPKPKIVLPGKSPEQKTVQQIKKQIEAPDPEGIYELPD